MIRSYSRIFSIGTKHRVPLFFGICLLIAGCLAPGCSHKIENPPKFTIPDYRPQLLFGDDFETESGNWQAEGVGSTVVGDGMLQVTIPPESQGFVLWFTPTVEKNFQIEYTLYLSDSSGTHGVYFCAEGKAGESILDRMGERVGRKEDYSHEDMRNYHLSVHVVNGAGNPLGWSRIRKNPNYFLLAHSDVDPCIQPRKYLMDIFKIENRILIYVDGVLIHDVKDKGGFDQPVHRSGKLGFRFDSVNRIATTRIDDLRVYQLNPI